MPNDREARPVSRGSQSGGGRPVDPTQNVIALVDAEKTHNEDLRILYDRIHASELLTVDAKLAHQAEVSRLRSEYEQRLSDCKSDCQTQVATLRAEQSREMNEAEANRLNSIRQVDVLAVNTAADRAAAAVNALAVTTAANAENLRTALNTTAATIAAQLAGTVATISERITGLERSSYEGKGRSAMQDPAMAELMIEMKAFSKAQSTGTGKSEGLGLAGQIVLGAVTFIVAMVAIGTFLVMLSRGQPQPVIGPQQPPVSVQPVK
jgi:hypothetical protein